MKDKTKEYLMLGIIGGILTMIGDCLLCGADSFGGAAHVICCYLMTGIKKDLEAGADNLLMTVLHEQGGYVIPSMIVFLIIYLMSVVTMILLVAKKKTFLPSWMWILNPLTFKLLINWIGRLGS